MPNPVAGFKSKNVHIRKGKLTLIAGGPGGGKSALTHSILWRGDKGKKPKTLYFCFDTDADDIWKRSAALATGKTMQDIEHLQKTGDTKSIEQAIAAQGNHIQWSFNPNASLEMMRDQLDAYVELYDEYPDAIVADNLKDLLPAEEGDEWRGLEDVLVQLKNLAIRTGIAVIALHHVGGEHENGTNPIPLGGLRGKVGKTPALVLTIHKPNPSEMRLSIVKNRGGQVDPTGHNFIRVETDLSAMKFRG